MGVCCRETKPVADELSAVFARHPRSGVPEEVQRSLLVLAEVYPETHNGPMPDLASALIAIAAPSLHVEHTMPRAYFPRQSALPAEDLRTVDRHEKRGG